MARHRIGGETPAYPGGHRLTEFRLARGLGQKELAAAVGTSKAQICHFEKGRRKPTNVMILKLADALRIHQDQLALALGLLLPWMEQVLIHDDPKTAVRYFRERRKDLKRDGIDIPKRHL